MMNSSLVYISLLLMAMNIGIARTTVTEQSPLTILPMVILPNGSIDYELYRTNASKHQNGVSNSSLNDIVQTQRQRFVSASVGYYCNTRVFSNAFLFFLQNKGHFHKHVPQQDSPATGNDPPTDGQSSSLDALFAEW